MKNLTFLIFILFFYQITASSQPCLPEGITFTTQAQIDNFQTNYPNCTEIEGDVMINGNDITNLNGLSVLTAIMGSLAIGQQYVVNNPLITSLTGLSNVTSIGGSLWIINNPILPSLEGLENLTSIGDYLGISDNPALISLAGLENLKDIPRGLSIRNNDALTSLTGLNNLTSIGEYLRISENKALTSLTGFNSLISIGGHLHISNNDTLTSLIGLDNVTSIGEYLEFLENNALTSLRGLENLTFIAGNLTIGIWNAGNSSLTCLTGLDNVTSIGGNIKIYGNASLTSLLGLNNLTSIGGYLAIIFNTSLTSLTGLDNIDAHSISNLFILENYSLFTCGVQSVCDYLVAPNGTIDIWDNSTGCNSKEEVQTACDTVGIPNISIEPEITIYPNPATNEINITLKNGTTMTEIIIYNQIGQKVLHKKRITNTIDVSILRQGMYVIELVLNELKIREKLIIR